MHLHPAAREYYRLAITTTPAVPSWEASFDGGENWHEGTDLDGEVGWLVAGPDADQGTAVAVISATVRPLLRAIDSPEIIIRSAPGIRLS